MFQIILTLLGQVVSKAHTYLLNLQVLSALNFCSEPQLSTDPTLCAITCSTWVYDSSTLATLVCRYIQLAASSVSCVEEYVRALGVSMKGKCWLDYTNFDMLPLY